MGAYDTRRLKNFMHIEVASLAFLHSHAKDMPRNPLAPERGGDDVEKS